MDLPAEKCAFRSLARICNVQNWLNSFWLIYRTFQMDGYLQNRHQCNAVAFCHKIYRELVHSLHLDLFDEEDSDADEGIADCRTLIHIFCLSRSQEPMEFVDYSFYTVDDGTIYFSRELTLGQYCSYRRRIRHYYDSEHILFNERLQLC